MDYAIVEGGIVTNIIWLLESNADEFPDAVSIKDRPVSIGDTYDGMYFWRDGVKVLTLLEEMQEMIRALQEGIDGV